MQIKNTGPRYRNGVELEVDGVIVRIPYNGTADVPDDLGAALCAEQPESFQKAKTAPKTKDGS